MAGIAANPVRDHRRRSPLRSATVVTLQWGNGPSEDTDGIGRPALVMETIARGIAADPSLPTASECNARA